MANARIEYSKTDLRQVSAGLVPKDRNAALAGIPVPMADFRLLDARDYKERLAERVQALIDREVPETAQEALRAFLNRDPDEPELPKDRGRWGITLVTESPTIQRAYRHLVQPDDLRPAKAAELRDIQATSLVEWLDLAVEAAA